MAKQGKRQRKFRYGEDNQPKGIAAGNKIFQKVGSTKLELIRPTWGKEAKGPLTFRPLPAFNPDEPEGPFDDTRLSTDPFDYSEFMISVPCAVFAGTTKKKLTCALWDPSDHSYSPYSSNPYVVFYSAITDALKKGEAIVNGRNVATSRWSKLQPANDKSKPLSSFKKLHFLQGLVYANDGKIFVRDGNLPLGAAPGSPLPIIQLASTAGRTIASKLSLPNDKYKGDTSVEHQREAYRYGELVAADDGKFITVYNHQMRRQVAGVPKGDPLDDPAQVEELMKKYGLKDQGSRRKKDDDNESDAGFYWSVAITPKFSYKSGDKVKVRSAAITNYEDEIRNKLQFWEDLLHFPVTDELALWVAEAFADFGPALEFAWADNPEFMTEEVRGVLVNRVSARGAFPDDEDDEGRGRIRRRPRDDDEDEDDDRGSRNRRRRGDEDEDEDDRPRRRSRREEDDEEEEERGSSRRRSRRDEDDEDEDEDDDRGSRSRNSRSKRRDDDEDEDDVEEVDEDESEDDDDDDGSGRVYDDDLDEDEAEEEEKPKRRAKANAKNRSKAYEEHDDLPDTSRELPKRRKSKVDAKKKRRQTNS